MKKSIDLNQLTGPENPLLRFPRLYEAALDEFSQKSLGEASLNDILRQSGMSKGSLYHHFGDKFGLYLALMDTISQKKIEFFLPRMQGLTPGADFFETIKLISREMMVFMFQDRRIYNLSTRLLGEEPDILKRLMACFPDEKEQMLQALAEGAVRSGQVDSRFTPTFLRNILDILLSNLHQLPGVDGTEEAYAQLELALDMMQHGLCGKREEGRKS